MTKPPRLPSPEHADRVLEGEIMSPEDEARAWLDFIETKSIGTTAWDEAIVSAFGALEPTESGVAVSSANALRVAAVFACCRVIAEDTAKLPIRMHRTVDAPDGGQRRQRILSHPVLDLVGRRPNEWMSGYEFREFMTFSAALYGESHAYINRVGNLSELLPLLPGSVQTRQDTMGSIERVIVGYGPSIPVTFDNLLTLRGPISHDPSRPFAPVMMAREAIGLSIAIEAATGRFHKNDLRPSGALSIELGSNISPEQFDRIRNDWRERFGRGGDGGIAILDKKFDFKPFNVTSADGQTIENRRFEIEEICRFFRVNPTKIGHPGQSVGYNGLEQVAVGHYIDSIMPWCLRWEGAIERDLLTPSPDGRSEKISISLDMDYVARGTFGDRMNAYNVASKVLLTPNELREREGLDPIDDPAMDRVQLQANNTGLVPGAKPAAEPQPKPGKPDKAEKPAEAETEADTEPDSDEAS